MYQLACGGPHPFAVNGRRYTLDVPADGAELVDVAASAGRGSGAWTSIVPGAVVEEEFHERLADGDDPLDMTGCLYILWDVAEELYGVPWWTAQRVAVTAQRALDLFAGYCVRVGFDLNAARPAWQTVSAQTAWLRSTVEGDEKKAARMERDLFMVPKHVLKARRAVNVRPRPGSGADEFTKQMQGLGGG